MDIVALSSNIRIIAESVARQVYNLTEADMPQLFTNGLVASAPCLRHLVLLLQFFNGQCNFSVVILS